MGFRSLGFINEIIIFEPNSYIYQNYIKNNLFKNYKNIIGFNFALGNKNQKKIFYYPYFKTSVSIIFVVSIKNILEIALE